MMFSINLAPMESLGSAMFRRLHAKYFGGCDKYFIPFTTPTSLPRFTPKQLKELSVEENRGYTAIPQLLTKRVPDFIWATKALADMGYKEINLNLGCPAGTVVASGRGSAMLKDLVKLDQFLDAIFSADLSLPISVKTRIGWAKPTEFSDIIPIFNRYPIQELTIHPRVKAEQYKGTPHIDIFEKAYKELMMPVAYNGDIVTPSNCVNVSHRFPDISSVMIGRGLVADPALARKIKGGKAATREEIASFATDLYEVHASTWGSKKNALMRMKEYWWFWANLFEDSHKPLKELLKAKSEKTFLVAAQKILDLPMREDALFGWFKPT